MTLTGIYALLGAGMMIGIAIGRVSAWQEMKEREKRREQERAVRESARHERAMESVRFRANVLGYR